MKEKAIYIVKKNYYRCNIIDLINNTGRKTIIVSGKYKHCKNQKWATFTCIRPYVKYKKTYTICDHLNVERQIVEKWYHLSEKYQNRKFYLIGNPEVYNHYGEYRGCLQLEMNLHVKPIIFTEEKYLITDTVLEKCLDFSNSRYVKE